MTTSGLQAALRERADIGHVETFYPFEYGGFHSVVWDVVVIEGWFQSIASFIHEARRVSRQGTHWSQVRCCLIRKVNYLNRKVNY